MDLAGISSSALTTIVLMASVIFVGGVAIGVVVFILRERRYREFKCVIWEKDGFGQLTQKYDKAGIFVDGKTKNKRFFLRKANVGLSPDNIPYIPSQRGNKVVYLFRIGLKNFHYIKPNVANPTIALNVGEEDVNWAINDYEKQKQMFSQNMLLQYLPFIALAFVSMVILIIFIYFFREFDTLQGAATALKEAAQALAQAKAGTTVIS